MKWIGYIWALPNTLIGLILALFYGAKDFQWDHDLLGPSRLTATTNRMIGSPGGQTWGWLVYVKSEEARIRRSLILHEGEHVDQGLRWGVFFLIAYAAEFAGRFIHNGGRVPDDWLEPNYWAARGYIEEEARAQVARRSSRWFRAYWNISWERKARIAAGQRVFP